VTDLEQNVESLRVEHKTMKRVGAGKDVGIKVNDMIYMVKP
jgi:hypothetical protein